MTIDFLSMAPPIDRARVKINNWEFKKAVLNNLLDETELVRENNGNNLNTSYFGERADVSEKVAEVLAEEIDLVSIKMFNGQRLGIGAWFQTYGIKQFHSVHIHPRVQAASVIYLSFDKEFHYPTQYLLTNAFFGHYETWSDKDDEEGNWYIWPGSVPHFTLPCDNPDAPLRKVMSINLTVL